MKLNEVRINSIILGVIIGIIMLCMLTLAGICYVRYTRPPASSIFIITDPPLLPPHILLRETDKYFRGLRIA